MSMLGGLIGEVYARMRKTNLVGRLSSYLGGIAAVKRKRTHPIQ